MPLHYPGKARERILLMGGYGAGKSQAWGEWARWSRDTGSKARFYAVDTDYGVDRMEDNYEGFSSNVEYRQTRDYDEILKYMRDCRKKATRDDILVLDMVGTMWGVCQGAFSEKAFGKNMGDWFIEAAKAGSMGAIAGDFGVNWGAINRMYGEIRDEFLRFPGHVIACTGVEEVRMPDKQGKGGDDVDMRQLFGRFGVKPEGQKQLGHHFHTILLLQDTGKEWKMTTVKDRNREKVKGLTVGDFVMDYLVPVAGWKP